MYIHIYIYMCIYINMDTRKNINKYRFIYAIHIWDYTGVRCPPLARYIHDREPCLAPRHRRL